MLFVAALLIVACPKSGAQVLYGSVNGIVTDLTGSAVVGVKVEAVEMQKGIREEATTESTGRYRFSEILPGA